MIHLLIVEDIQNMRDSLRKLFEAVEDISIADVVSSDDAVESVIRKNPDVLLLDTVADAEKSMEIIEYLMEEMALPIVALTENWQDVGTGDARSALRSGAVAEVNYSSEKEFSDTEEVAKQIVYVVKAMAEVKVVTRRRRRKMNAAFRIAPTTLDLPIVAIGASTGGPSVLQVLLSKLPVKLRAAVLIVQHISPGFIGALRGWLQRSSNIPVYMGEHGMKMETGCVYIAPDGYHMAVNKESEIVLEDSSPENHVKPSIGHLFRSLAQCNARMSICILLSGMGRDGAKEMLDIKKAGGVTIVQDKETSVVYGMPGAALELGAAMYVMDPVRIAQSLESFLDSMESKWKHEK
ncbi:MAG: chemotaxis protein CheB [Chitinivibrionales bacterium]